MLVVQLRDTVQRAGTVSPCSTASLNHPNVKVSWFYSDITASLPDTACTLQSPFFMDLVKLGQKPSDVAFQETKCRKVLEIMGCFLTRSPGNPHAGTELARDIHTSSC